MTKVLVSDPIDQTGIDILSQGVSYGTVRTYGKTVRQKLGLVWRSLGRGRARQWRSPAAASASAWSPLSGLQP